MISLHVRPRAFNMADAIFAAAARSPSCAEPNMPAMRASLSMASATIAAGLPWEGHDNTTRHSSSLAGFALRQCGDPGADDVCLGASTSCGLVGQRLILLRSD
jgi:hypothetical protein